MPINNKAMKNPFLGILVLSHVISISIVIGSEEESNDNGKFHEEAEFGVDASEDSDEEKPETKAHYAPSQSYYILNDPQKTASFSPSTINSKLSAKQRPNSNIWRPLFSNFQRARAVSYYPKKEKTQKTKSSWTPPPYLFQTLPPLTPKDLPEQLRIIGSSILADLIERAGLTEALQSPGPFTVFAPTDKAFEKFIGERGDEYKNVILSDKTLLQYILLQHVAPDKLRSNELSDGQEIGTLADNSLTIMDTKDGLTIAGALFTSGGLNQLASNGIIHSIEDVIYPYVSDEVATTPKPKFRLREERRDDPRLVIRLQNGRIRGVNLNLDVRAWLGIPYAEPPTGRYRFARPRQLRNWDRDFIRDTVNLPNACPQTPDTFFGNFSGSQQWNPNTLIDEDCLYLNVFAPRNRTTDETNLDVIKNITSNPDESNLKDLPVLVWIYGGGYMAGSSSLDMYNPEEIVKRGNIIFVSMQYRVGSHGFLHFGKDSSSPGNVGLLDQVLALEWVRDNIKAFGGNPNEVTIMGDNSGATNVALHMMSPLSCGLFKKAILQSSGATPRWGFMTQDEGLQRSIKLAQEVGCSYDPFKVEDTLDCMRDKPAKEITDKEYYVDDYSLNFFPFVPTVDETFMPLSPQTLVQEGLIKDTSILIGTNANEGYWSLLYLLPSMFPNNELKLSDREFDEKKYEEAVGKIFSFHPKPIQTLIAHEYRDKFTGPDKLFKALDQMAADSDMVCQTEEFAQIMAKNGNRVYRYFYNHQSSKDPWPTWSGSKHGDELEFTFGLPLKKPKEYSAQEIKFTRDIITYWTNFVKNGSPNPSNALPTWPEYRAPEWQYLNLTVGVTGLTGSKQISDQCRFFNNVMPEFVPRKNDKTDVNLVTFKRYSC